MEAKQRIDVYPYVRTIFAFGAGASCSILANIENYKELGFEYIAYNASAIGLTILVLVKLLALPIALIVNIHSGFGYKVSYIETLKKVYFIPYGLFFVMFTFFTLVKVFR